MVLLVAKVRQEPWALPVPKVFKVTREKWAYRVYRATKELPEHPLPGLWALLASKVLLVLKVPQVQGVEATQGCPALRDCRERRG
jgi:hypothetical protein